LFGAYVRHLLNQELKRPQSQDRLELIHGDVVGLETIGCQARLQIGRGKRVDADIVVLAIGNFPPEAPPVADPAFYDSAFYRPDPWAANAFADLDADAPVLMIGTGLTMVDAVISLLGLGHRGAIHAVSRRGLLPCRHGGEPFVAPGQTDPFPTSLTTLTRFLRRESRRAKAGGGSWHQVVDQLRPFSQDLWSEMSMPDRARFLRHLRPWWDIHRHRLAPAVAARIDGATASGQLRIDAGASGRFAPLRIMSRSIIGPAAPAPW
jgi:uncharacterized NAD(P)/FAD-binding protein YdhS